MIARLLHICNSQPYCFGSKEEFYALKARLLERFGTPDGYDVQHIEGKHCWSCDGTGTFYHYSGTPDTCHKCYGSGWYKWPVWVTLKRYRFGRYVFHTPQERSYQKPATDVTHIEGYVQHANYDWRTVRRAGLLLSLLYERQIFWRLARERIQGTWLARTVTRRCIACSRHTWSSKWRCRACKAMPNEQQF